MCVHEKPGDRRRGAQVGNERVNGRVEGSVRPCTDGKQHCILIKCKGLCLCIRVATCTDEKSLIQEVQFEGLLDGKNRGRILYPIY